MLPRNLVLSDLPQENKHCIVNTEAAIYENELFDMMAVRKLSIGDVLADETDYKALAREEKAKGGDLKLITRYQDLHAIKLGAKPLNRNLDRSRLTLRLELRHGRTHGQTRHPLSGCTW